MAPVTAETSWLSMLADVPGWSAPPVKTVVVSPHPDDETLGAGGLIASQRLSGVPVTVAAVTDGEAAYPDSAYYADNLGPLREVEQEYALAALGVGAQDIVRLRLQDGGVAAKEDRLYDLIWPHMSEGCLLVAPWSGDSHPDHEACGRAAERLASELNVTAIYYVFWAWHQSAPQVLTKLPLRRFELNQRAQDARTLALSFHRSQLKREDDGPPVLPEALLSPARRSFETFIVHA